MKSGVGSRSQERKSFKEDFLLEHQMQDVN